MSQYDLLYKQQVEDIIKNGVLDKDQAVRTKWADGSSAYTKSLISRQLSFDNSEVPILTTKRVAWKSAIHELIWFYVKRTSNAQYLDDNNVKIWKEWTRADNSIGRAYGYQLGKSIIVGYEKKYSTFFIPEVTMSSYIEWQSPIFNNQVHNLIQQLKTNPASRRHIISLWNIDDLHDMALFPCLWNNQWLVKEGKLHLIVQVRSNDTALGQPFNVFQYYVLQRMIAQVTGYEMGTLTFNINDCHIYERHIDQISEQVQLEPYNAPELWINPEVKNFDDFTIDDFKLIGYEYHPSLSYEVAI